METSGNMNNKNLFVTIILLLAFVGLTFIGINYRWIIKDTVEVNPYEENLRALNDTITNLKEDIKKYEEEVTRLENERVKTKKLIERITRDHDKIDSELLSGDWDYNYQFITKFLSEEDNFRE